MALENGRRADQHMEADDTGITTSPQVPQRVGGNGSKECSMTMHGTTTMHLKGLMS